VTPRKALLLIAHGSRRPEANADLAFVADEMAARGRYPIVQVSYLELAQPSIPDGGALCVQRGATEVILLPYFLSPGVHVHEDMTAARDELAKRFPHVTFRLAEPLGRHPLLLDVVEQRAAEAEGG
jgi:sirohydrochlorin ferrochelatase